ncbi:MAG: phospholipase [Rhizobiales bacterium 32-66-8]|nr:MAG: phospholipase [Rhizobiales bacterium 32-66-8]
MLAEGANCWRISHAARAAVLVDGCAYFARLDEAVRKARRSILIVGWDFDGRIVLRPDLPEAEQMALGPLLRQRVEAEPDLEVRVLIWSTAVVHAPSGTAELLIGDTWQEHPRIQVRLDTTHPLYGAHHQKIVCIDGAIAFVGGMDLTVDRWDTPDHRAQDARRKLPDGSPYGPVHDLQMMLEGEVAGDVCTLATKRWHHATGEDVPLPACGGTLWPEALAPHFTDTPVAISRAMPRWGERAAVAESPRLTADALRAARDTIFIEAQYLTAAFIANILHRHLQADEGPEIVCVVSFAAHSVTERLLMGENRDRLIRRLWQADRHDRFRVYHPVGPGTPEGCPILIHSKLIIVDDRFLRLGSSNLNNRSIGLDTELDLSIEARAPEGRAAILAVRDQLLGEHLGTSAETIARATRETGSLVKAVEQLNGGDRRLKPFDTVSRKGPTQPMFATALLDPAHPFEPDWMLRRK